MIRSSFLGHIYNSFLGVYGPVLSFLALAFSIAGWFFVPAEVQVLVKVLAIVLLFSLLATMMFAHASYVAFSERTRILPSVLYAEGPPNLYNNEGAIALLLLEESPLFGHDHFASVYQLENHVERLVGIGRVINIQEDQKVQVLVRTDIGYPEVWKAVRQGNKGALQRLIVRACPKNRKLTQRKVC